ncbi:MAG: hypothetical protein KDJ65_17185 [Anaerolineae bacterium]|nr:hypothetical protein [Anaerolineae bacterium]
MTQVQDPRQRLIQHHLNEAQKALDTDNLTEAQKYFEEALEVGGEHPDRASDIRQPLKKYCDRMVSQPNPNWQTVHQVLDIFDRLKLQNDEIRAYQRELRLKEAKFLLEKHDNLDDSFNIFTSLLVDAERLGSQEDKVRNRIAKIVGEYVSQRAGQRQWALLNPVFERVTRLWPPNDTIHLWLETISQILAAANQAQIGFDREVNDLKKTKNTLTIALIALFVLVILSYAVVLFS